MAFLTATDDQLLKSWNFYADSANDTQFFIDVGKAAYKSMMYHGKHPPQPGQLVAIFRISLLASQKFANYMNTKKSHMLPAIWPVFATAVVRYMLDNQWGAISGP
jgi:hypothetical protein